MNIYVGNLPWKGEKQDLIDAFGEFGEISSAVVMIDRETGRSRGFGFVEMPNDDQARAAIAALNGKELMDRELRVNESQPRKERSFSAPRRDSRY